MIVWINGCFGVGKTEVSKKLNNRIEKSIIYDPELIGSYLIKNMPYKKEDFQDYALWRKMNNLILKELSKDFEIIIVPMTIINENYYNEIVDKINTNIIQIKLLANKTAIQRRLETREEGTTEWTYTQINRVISGLEKIKVNLSIDTSHLKINEVVNKIEEYIKKYKL